ncbi:MAG: hypothetical protein ACSHWW_05030 [Nonlabens sp.]|uniref:hypothetical protein n=1 Tax=Nonlabens sp. TaxID=1888209 RepID=UPI003EFA6DB9
MKNSKTIFLPINFEIQSTLQYLRELFVGFGFNVSSVLYVFFKKGNPWHIHTRQLLSYPSESLGYHLGCFLLQHKFEPQPRCEDHDVFHVLTGFKVDTAQEIAMQFWLWGNGKRSPFVALAMLVGMILYLDQYANFTTALANGKNTAPIHHIDFKQCLSSPISKFKTQS